MTYVVTWGRDKWQAVAGVAELDKVLEVIGAHGGRSPSVPTDRRTWTVRSHPGKSRRTWRWNWAWAIRIARSWCFFGAGGGEGTDPGMPPWPGGAPDIEFDYGGDPVFCGPNRARVRPETARQAAREFVATGRRPTCVTWQR